MSEYRYATEVDAVVRSLSGAVAPKPLSVASPEAVVVPEGATLHIPDVERFRDSPRRARGTYRPATVDSFLAYTQRHQYPEATTVWVHPTSGRVVAIFDDNAPEGPGWRDHQAHLQLQHTPEWSYWLAQDGRMLGQEEFAEHVEGGLEEIVEPDAATMLEIAQSFHATTSAQFRSSTRLASGEQRLQYDEEVQAAAGKTGDLNVPSMVLLAIAPFVGEERYKVAARFRFRVTRGTLTLGYRLDRPDAVVRDALEKIAEKIAAELPLTYVGDPPA